MIKEMLISLRMQGAVNALTSLEKVTDRNEFVVELLKAEKAYRGQIAAKRRLSEAKFPLEKEWSDIDPLLNKEIEFDAVKLLGDGQFVKKRHNLCLMGQQGTGKTHSLIALVGSFVGLGIVFGFTLLVSLLTFLKRQRRNTFYGKLWRSC